MGSEPADRGKPVDATTDSTRSVLAEVARLAFPMVLASASEVARLAFPMVLASASATLMHFVDVLLVSKLGTTDLAAVMPAGILVFCFIALASGASSCVNTFVSQSFGKEDFRACSAYAWQNTFVALILGAGVLPL